MNLLTKIKYRMLLLAVERLPNVNGAILRRNSFLTILSPIQTPSLNIENGRHMFPLERASVTSMILIFRNQSKLT